MDRELIKYDLCCDTRSRIVIDFTLEDSEFLTAAVSHTCEWQHSPHITRLPHGCDPESALGYLAEDE